MFQSSLSNQYTHLYNEISRLDDKSVAANSRESSPDNEASLLSAQIKNFIKARIALVGNSMDFLFPVPKMAESYSTCFKAPISETDGKNWFMHRPQESTAEIIIMYVV